MPPHISKGWRDSVDKTPQHKFDLLLTDFYAPRVAAALTVLVDSLPVLSTISAFSHANVSVTDLPRLREQIKAMLGGKSNTQALTDVLTDIYADAYTAGLHATETQLGEASQTVKKAEAIDWSAWVPGDTASAIKLADGGLQKLLDNAGISIDDMDTATVDRVGNLIANGLADGSSVDTIARTIREDAGSPFRATMIAHTESSRGIAYASTDSYSTNGVGDWEIIVSDGACSECLALVGQHFPVGDANDMPPIHPLCRCSTLPVIGSMS